MGRAGRLTGFPWHTIYVPEYIWTILKEAAQREKEEELRKLPPVKRKRPLGKIIHDFYEGQSVKYDNVGLGRIIKVNASSLIVKIKNFHGFDKHDKSKIKLITINPDNSAEVCIDINSPRLHQCSFRTKIVTNNEKIKPITFPAKNKKHKKKH